MILTHNINMKKLLFIDRDGTLIIEPQPSQQIDSLEKLKFVPGAIFALARLVRETDFELVMVTNQDGLGTASFPEETFWPAHQKMMQLLENEGVVFKEVLIDRSFPHENLPTRKPEIGMLKAYLNGDFDLKNSFVIGDRLTDVLLAKNLGTKAIFLKNKENDTPEMAKNDFIAENWEAIYQHLILPPRRVLHSRITRETNVQIELNLDGTGTSDIQTGLGFFDHMLDQLAKHGQIDLKLHTKGDLHIDEHHTIEDTALALGEAFDKALGEKRGITRYGFCLPMDDVLAQVALDFGGRPWLVWAADFKREKIGEMPTEMFLHFFKSFSDAARCNLNIKAEGSNEHHKIEAIFKAFAKSIRMAVKREAGNRELPTTKGIL
jgi:imidazoleglycerol-phosphate dehydratase / histidinol-phosphatase